MTTRNHRRAPLCIALIACLHLLAAQGHAQILELDTDTLTTYLPSAKTNVQDVRPRHEQRGVLIDGTLVSPPNFAWQIAGDPWASMDWNRRVDVLSGVRGDTGTYAIDDVDIALPAPGFSWVIGRSYNHRQVNSSDALFVSDGPQGKNWFQNSQPELVLYDVSGEADDRLYLVYGADRYIAFRRVTGGSNVTYRATNGAAGAIDFLEDGSGADLYKYVDQRGTQVWFFGFDDTGDIPAAKEGQIWKIKDPAGNTAYVGDESNKATALSSGFNASGQIIKAYDSATSLGRRRYLYTYSSGRLESVQAQTKSGGTWASPTGVLDIARVDYSYHDGMDSTGNDGDLKRVTITEITADGMLDQVREKYYRYYTGAYGDSNRGLPSQIKLILGYEGARRFDWGEAGMGEPEFDQGYESASVSDNDLKPYAMAYFEYTDDSMTPDPETDRRIDVAVFNGECGCSGGVDGTYTLDFEQSSYYSSNKTTGYDSFWARRVVITSPDDAFGEYLETTNYFDETGQPLSEVLRNWNDTPAVTDTWATKVVRDSDGFVETIHSPANMASAGYNHTTGAITGKSSEGLVLHYSRVGSGDMEHFPEHFKHSSGESGGADKYLDGTLEYTSASLTVGDFSVVRPLVASSWEYQERTEDDVLTGSPTGAYEIAVTYTSFWPTDAALIPKEVTTTYPAVSQSKNGSGSATSMTQYFRSDGSMAFRKATDGVFTYFSQDALDLPDRVIEDAQTNHASDYDSGDDPNGAWSITESGAGLHEVVDATWDEMGRPTTSTLDPGDIARKSRSFYTFLADRRTVVLEVPYYETSPTKYFGPVGYEVVNLAGQTEFSGVIGVDSAGEDTALTSWIDDTDEDPLEALSGSVGDAVRMNTMLYDDSGARLEESRTYHDIPTSGEGSQGTSYERFQFGYDDRGRRDKVITPKGTVFRMRLDPRGSILAERHSGWDDSGWGGGEGASMFVHETYLPNVNANFPTNGAGRPMIWAGGIAQDGSEPGSLDGGGSSDGSSAGPGPGQGGCVKRGGHPSWQEAMHLSAGYCYIVDGVCYVINEENQPSTVIYRDVQSLAVARENPEPPHLLVQHDNGGRVTAIGMYSATSTGWEEEDPLTYTTNRVGLMEYAYDELGRVWKMTRWEINSGSKGDSVETQYWYDARGRVIKTEGEQLVKSKYDGLGRATRQYILATIDDTDYDDADDLADDIVLQEQIRAYEPGTRDLVLEAVVARFHDDDAAGTEGALDTNADGDELKLTASNLEGRVQIVARWYDNLGRLIEEVAYGTFGLNEPSGPTDFDRDGLSVPTRAADKLRASYEYDSAGELHEITDTRDKTTRYEYDDAGRRTAVILNYTGATTPITNLTRDTDLYTRFKYGTYEADDSSPPPSTDSWVNEVWVDLDGDGEQDAGVDQVTAYTYGVDSNSTPTSLVYGGEFLYEIKYPDSGSATDVVTLGYDRGGKLEHIWDQEGNKVDLDRDDIGRVIRAKPTFAGGTSLSQWVDWLEYSYNGLGLLERVTQAGDSSTVNEVVIEYDGWWLPKTIKQDHNSAISSDHYAVSHLHDDASGGRRTVRRTSSTYPGSNTIDYVYTSAGNVLDGDASRLSKIDFGAVTLATYDYLGVQQVVGTEYPEADVFRRQYGSSGLYPDLDRFGHVVSDRWTKDLATDIDFYDVAVSYDMGSNPTLALDAVHKEIFDWEYTIDGFGRVQQAERGDWDPNATPDPTFATTSQDQLWDYTLLGGWDLHKLDIDGDGSFTGYGSGDLQDKGTLNEVNELTGRNTDNSGGNEYSPTYDALGNLTDDDENYKYKYDIFGRLVEVQDQSGDPVAFYEYDGLGRLIRAWNEDTDTDGDLEKVDDDPIDLVYDERWRLVTVHEDLDADPYELFVHHEAGMDGGGSYIDAMVCRMRDTDTGTAGFEERLYYCQNYRNDVVAIVSDTGTQVEQVRYSAYGVPFGLPAGDTDSDGDVGTFEYLDVQDWINTSTYDVRGDLDLDGDLDIDDINAVAGASGQTLGWGVQSRTAIESRFGYGGYMWDRFVSKNHVRHRAYDPYLGRWLTRDPIGYSAGTMSLYEYVGASPLSYSDPMGLQLIIVEHPWLFPRNPPQAPIVPRDGRPNRAPYDILPGDSVDDILRKQQQAIRDGHKDANRLRLRADDMTCCYTIADGMQELTGGTFKNDWDEVLRETEDAVEDIAIEYATVGLLVCGLNPRNRLSEICDKLVKKNNGKTRVTLPDGRVVDLKGQGHYNKGCGKRIETPHVYHPKQRLHPDKKRRKDVNPATDQDLKDVEDYLNPPDPDPR